MSFNPGKSKYAEVILSCKYKKVSYRPTIFNNIVETLFVILVKNISVYTLMKTWTLLIILKKNFQKQMKV